MRAKAGFVFVLCVLFAPQIFAQSAGVITRIAGTTPGYAGDGGPATSARLSNPLGVVVDATGNVFVADSGTNEFGRFLLRASLRLTQAMEHPVSPAMEGRRWQPV